MWRNPRKMKKAAEAAIINHVLVSTLDAAPEEPITFMLEREVPATLWTGLYSSDSKAERRVRFCHRVVVISYPWEGLFTPKVVYDDGNECTLATIAVRVTDEVPQDEGFH